MAYGFGYILACVNSVLLNFYEQGDNAIIWYRVHILPHLYQTLSLGAPPPKPPTVTFFASTSYEVTRTQIQVRSTTLTTGVTSIVITTAAPNPTAWPAYQPLPTLSLLGFEVPQLLTTSTQPFNFGYNGYNTNNPILLLCVALAFYCIVSISFTIIAWVWRTAFAPWFFTSPKSRPRRPLLTTPPPDYSASPRAPWYDNFRNNCYEFCVESWRVSSPFLEDIYFGELIVNAFWFTVTMMWTIGFIIFWVLAIPTFFGSIIGGVGIVIADASKTMLQKHLRPRLGRKAILFWWRVKYRPMCEVALGMKVERTSDNHTPQSKLRRIIVMFCILLGTISRRDLRVPPPPPPELYQFDPNAYLDIPLDPEETITNLLARLQGIGDVHQAIENERDEARRATADAELKLKNSYTAYNLLNGELSFLRSSFRKEEGKWDKDQSRYERTIKDLRSREQKAKDSLSNHLKAVKESADTCINCKEVKAQMEQIAGVFSVSQQEFSESTGRAQRAETDLATSKSTNQLLQTSNQELQANNQQLQNDVQRLSADVQNLRDSLQKETVEKEVYLEKAKRVELELLEGRCSDTTNVGNALQNDADPMVGLLNDVDHQIQQRELQQEQQLQGQQLVAHNPPAVSSPYVVGQWPADSPQSNQGHQFQQQQQQLQQQQQQSVWAVQMEEDQPQPAPTLGFHRVEAPQSAKLIPGLGMIDSHSVEAPRQNSQQPTAGSSIYNLSKLSHLFPSTPSVFGGNSSNPQPLQRSPTVEEINPFSVPPKAPQRNPWRPLATQPQVQTPNFKVPGLPASASGEVRLQPLKKSSFGPPPPGIRRNGPIPFN